MSRDSLIFGVAGVFFGVVVGWIIGSQQAGPLRPPVPAAQTAQRPQGQTPPPAAPFDERRAAALTEEANRDPRSARTRIELANLYYDSERFDDAARWYEEALKIEPKNVSASTDLGISYYYTNQPDRALAQFDRSLAIDPTHAKTLLNIGIVRAYGKDDLEGAVKAWQRVVDLAPDSPEGKVAKQALDAVRNAHPNVPGSTPQAKSPGTQ